MNATQQDRKRWRAIEKYQREEREIDTLIAKMDRASRNLSSMSDEEFNAINARLETLLA